MRSIAFFGALGLTLFARVVHAAPTQQACVQSYEDGQKLRAEGKLSAARREFLVCAETSCPDLTKNDCGAWLAEVDASVPTLSFAVMDRAGNDVTDVRVTIDGTLLVERLDGKAVPVDPGPHKLSFDRAGEPTVTMELVVREGEKNRKVDVRFGGGATSGSSGGGISAVSPAAWALGATGIVGLSIFGVLGGLGLSEKSDADDTCSPNCTDEVVDSIRTKFIAADVALSVGLLSLGAGVAIGIATGLSGDGNEQASAQWFVSSTPFGGVSTGLRGTF